jgi:hypothetical protein
VYAALQSLTSWCRAHSHIFTPELPHAFVCATAARRSRAWPVGAVRTHTYSLLYRPMPLCDCSTAFQSLASSRRCSGSNPDAMNVTGSGQWPPYTPGLCEGTGVFIQVGLPLSTAAVTVISNVTWSGQWPPHTPGQCEGSGVFIQVGSPNSTAAVTVIMDVMGSGQWPPHTTAWQACV